MSKTPWKEMTEEQKERQRGYRRKWHERNKEEIKASHTTSTVYARYKGSARQRYIQQKQEALVKLGGVCIQCGIDDIRCLQIDHILRVNGDRSLYGAKLYRYIAFGGSTDNLQILCANCHAIKTFEESLRV